MFDPKSLPERLLISSREEAEHIAEQLANEYIEYFDIDISHDQECYQDSVEECLAHLEEVISAIDGYKQSSVTIDDFVSTVVGKEETLKKLFRQVDAIEQYAFESNRLLDQMDVTLKELEKHQSLKDGKIKQILHMIPGVSNLPRLGLFSAIGLAVDETPMHNFVESPSNGVSEQGLSSISEILDRLKHIEASLSIATKKLDHVHSSRESENIIDPE